MKDTYRNFEQTFGRQKNNSKPVFQKRFHKVLKFHRHDFRGNLKGKKLFTKTGIFHEYISPKKFEKHISISRFQKQYKETQKT